MSKKDIAVITIALVLLAGIFVIGANADFFRQKIRTDKQNELAADSQVAALNFKESRETDEENYSTSSQNIFISWPRPKEIIKGTVFTIEGNVSRAGEMLNIEIREKGSGNLWFSSGVPISEQEKDFSVWSLLANTGNHGGWAIIEVFLKSKDGQKIESISFPIKISPSI